jgi:hypothetical protein
LPAFIIVSLSFSIVASPAWIFHVEQYLRCIDVTRLWKPGDSCIDLHSGQTWCKPFIIPGHFVYFPVTLLTYFRRNLSVLILFNDCLDSGFSFKNHFMKVKYFFPQINTYEIERLSKAYQGQTWVVQRGWWVLVDWDLGIVPN